MPEGKIIHIRLNESDLNDLEIIRDYLEEKYKDLPPKFREVTTTDCIKYAIVTCIRNWCNPEDKIL